MIYYSPLYIHLCYCLNVQNLKQTAHATQHNTEVCFFFSYSVSKYQHRYMQKELVPLHLRTHSVLLFVVPMLCV